MSNSGTGIGILGQFIAGFATQVMRPDVDTTNPLDSLCEEGMLNLIRNGISLLNSSEKQELTAITERNLKRIADEGGDLLRYQPGLTFLQQELTGGDERSATVS